MSVTCVITEEKYTQLRYQLQQFRKALIIQKNNNLQTFLLFMVSFSVSSIVQTFIHEKLLLKNRGNETQDNSHTTKLISEGHGGDVV